MNDLNSYIMLKDHDVVPGKISHHIGISAPANEELLYKLQKFQHQQQLSSNVSKSRERKGNPS
jgi:hypothetical protein